MNNVIITITLPPSSYFALALALALAPDPAAAAAAAAAAALAPAPAAFVPGPATAYILATTPFNLNNIWQV